MNEIGVFGLGTMGLNLSKNLATQGFKVSVYNRLSDLTDNIIDSADKYNLNLAVSIENFVNSLEKPRKIILMVTSGEAVDLVIKQLSQYLDDCDIIIDGGNSHYKDSNRRYKELKNLNIDFVAMGISGGADGARFGPSLMPSCDKNVYKKIEPYLMKIAAKTENGYICCKYLGNRGAGHFIKTIHNGIEYAEMQLIADIVSILKHEGKSNEEIAVTLNNLNQDLTKSYLLDITINILNTVDQKGIFVLDQIVDIARQNGTGKWTVQTAVEYGLMASVLNSALEARINSEKIEKRETLGKYFGKIHNETHQLTIDEWKDVLLLSRVLLYEQSFEILRIIGKQMEWDYSLTDILKVWCSGCIIDSQLVKQLSSMEMVNDASSLLYIPEFKELFHNKLEQYILNTSKVTSTDVYCPVLTSIVSYFKGLISMESNANLIQAMRNYFGQHPLEFKGDYIFEGSWNDL